MSDAKVQARLFFDNRIDLFEETYPNSKYTILTMPSNMGVHECDILKNRFYKNEDYKSRVRLITVDRDYSDYTELHATEMTGVELDTRSCRKHIRGEVNEIYNSYCTTSRMIAWLDLVSGPTESNVAKILDNLVRSVSGSRIYVTFVLDGRDGGDYGRPWVGNLHRLRFKDDWGTLVIKVAEEIRRLANARLIVAGRNEHVGIAYKTDPHGPQHLDGMLYHHDVGRQYTCAVLGFVLGPKRAAITNNHKQQMIELPVKDIEELVTQEAALREKIAVAREAWKVDLKARYLQYERLFGEPFDFSEFMPHPPEMLDTVGARPRVARAAGATKIMSTKQALVKECLLAAKEEWEKNNKTEFEGVRKAVIVAYLEAHGAPIGKQFQYLSDTLLDKKLIVRVGETWPYLYKWNE